MEQNLMEKENFLSGRLREIRLSFGFTQADIANALNVSRSTYSYYEEGKTRPDPAVLGKLSSYYDIPIEFFYNDYINLSASLKDSVGRNKRISRSSKYNIEKIGELRPVERSLILLLRSNGKISAKDALESLEFKLEQMRGEESGDSKRK